MTNDSPEFCKVQGQFQSLVITNWLVKKDPGSKWQWSVSLIEHTSCGVIYWFIQTDGSQDSDYTWSKCRREITSSWPLAVWQGARGHLQGEGQKWRTNIGCVTVDRGHLQGEGQTLTCDRGTAAVYKVMDKSVSQWALHWDIVRPHGETYNYRLIWNNKHLYKRLPCCSLILR